MNTGRYYHSLTEFVKKPKTTIYTGAIFSFLAVSLFGWYAIRPTLQTILFLKREIADNTVVSKQMEEKIGKLIEAQALYQSVKSRLPLLNAAVPDDPSAVAVVGQLSDLARISGATVSAINVSTVPLVLSAEAKQEGKKPRSPQVSKVGDIPIQLVASGTYTSLSSLLSQIINLRRIITIEGITVTPEKVTTGQEPGPDVQLRMVVKLQAHYLKE